MSTDRMIGITADAYLAALGLDLVTSPLNLEPAWASLRDINGQGLARGSSLLALAKTGWVVTFARSLSAGMTVQVPPDLAEAWASASTGGRVRAELALRGLVLEDPYPATHGQLACLIVLTTDQRRQLDERTAALVSGEDE